MPPGRIIDAYQGDTVNDFSPSDADLLMIDDAIRGGGIAASDIVTTHAVVRGGDVVLNFRGGDVLTHAGLADTTGLDAHITIV